MPLTIAILLLLLCCSTTAQKPFTEVSKDAGVDHKFLVFQGSFGGSAVAFNYDNDNFKDVYNTGGTGSDALFKNKGNAPLKMYTIKPD